MPVKTWVSARLGGRNITAWHILTGVALLALAALYIAATARMFTGGWLYLDDYAKCEIVKNDGLGAAISHYWSLYSSAYRPLTAGPVAWLGSSCNSPELVTIPAAVMHFGTGIALAFAVGRLTHVRVAGLVTACAWWFTPFQAEILGWPTNAAAYVPVALLTACSLAVLFYPGDLSRVGHRRWIAFAILAFAAFAMAEQMAVAVIALLGILAIASPARRTLIPRVALYAAAPFVAYLGVVAATSGGSSYSRTDTAPGSALTSIWSNVENHGLFTGLDTLPGGHYWVTFGNAAWRGQWFSAIAIFGLLTISLVILDRFGGTRTGDDRPRIGPALALGSGAFLGIVLGFLLNSIEAPLWVSPRMFYLPGLFVALFLGSVVALLVGQTVGRTQLVLRAVSVVAIAGIATVGVLVLRNEGALYRENARLEASYAREIGKQLPPGDMSDVAIVGLPWTVVGAGGGLVPLGEHIVSSIRVQWAFPSALAWYTGRSVRSVTFWELPDWCAAPANGQVAFFFDGSGLRTDANSELCAPAPGS